jgi:hypothetical protein
VAPTFSWARPLKPFALSNRLEPSPLPGQKVEYRRWPIVVETFMNKPYELAMSPANPSFFFNSVIRKAEFLLFASLT